MQDLQNFFTFSLPKLDSSIGPAAAAHFKGLSRGEGSERWEWKWGWEWDVRYSAKGAEFDESLRQRLSDGRTDADDYE